MEKTMTARSDETVVPLVPPAIAPAATASSAFRRPKFARRSEMLAHVPFLFWLIDAARPRRVVELGLGRGVSYFATCQAIESLGLDAETTGIDHGRGDATLKPTAAEREEVRRYNDEQFREFSTLLPETDATQAAGRFAPGSVDLLIVDLELTPQIVESLRAEWLERLSARGVLVVHGTRSRVETAEARRFLEGLTAAHPAIRLLHGAGLVAVAVGETAPEPVRRLADMQEAEEGAETARLLERLGEGCEAGWLREALAEAETRREAAEREAAETTRSLERRFHEIAVLTGEIEAGASPADLTAGTAAPDRSHLLIPPRKARRWRRSRLWRRGTELVSLYRGWRLLRESPLFDADWYRRQYPDVAGKGADPVRHYLRFGALEGRDPGPDFATLDYYAANPDVADTGANPLVHYLKFGRTEGRKLAP